MLYSIKVANRKLFNPYKCSLFMTSRKTIERTWIGNELFEIVKYLTINNKRYAKFTASVSRPDVRRLTFRIPKDALSFLPTDSEPIGSPFFPVSPLDGDSIVERNNNLQRVSIGNRLIYDRTKDGF